MLPTTNPVLSDPAVRRTISLAVDRNALVSGSFLGAAQPVAGPIPPGHWADDHVAPPARDLGQAVRCSSRPAGATATATASSTVTAAC